MSMELIAIISVMISASMALAGLILIGQNSLRREIQKQREETQGEFKSMREETQAEFKSLREGIGDLRERMAHLEGLLEGLREAITGRRVAESPANYDTR